MAEGEPNLLQSVLRGLLKLFKKLEFFPPLFTRLLLGTAFAQGGWGKLHNLDGVTDYFTSLGIPMPHANAVFISNLEFFGGIGLILGLFTRPFAALLGATMLVASLSGDKKDMSGDWYDLVKAVTNYNMPGVLGVTPIVFGMFLLWLLVYGPGVISLDAMLRRFLGVDKRESAKHSSSSESVTKAETL